MSLIYDVDFNSGTRVLSLLDKAGNVISSCEVPSKELVDDITKPLTLRATQDGSTVTLRKNGSPTGDLQTSRDGGNTWTDYTIDTAITLNTGDEVSFRAKSDRSAQILRNYFRFWMTGKIEAWHNVMSLYRTNDFATYDTVVDYAFQWLFESCTSLTKAPVLPATTLADSCYWSMFYGCESLTKAPVLPATTLAVDCYYEMFVGCSKLKEVRISATKTASRALDNWLSGVSATGDFYCDPNSTIFPTNSASGIPKGWRRLNIDEEAPTVDDITKPLTFKATQDGSTVKLTKKGFPEGGDFQTSTDGGNTWVDYTIGTAITLNTGDEVSFRAKADRTGGQAYYRSYFFFQMTGKIEAWHNVMSMIRKSDFATYDAVFPSGLTHLFDGCTSLTKAPALPATKLSDHSLSGMFAGCTSLVEAPELPATTLVDSCYYLMFSGCASLTKAPELPATTLANYCYQNMFEGCASLTKAPELPATKLAQNCYLWMFKGCRSLKEVRVSATTTATDALKDWLSDVSATGDFYCDPNATIFPTDSASGIPKNWVRHALSDYPATP